MEDELDEDNAWTVITDETFDRVTSNDNSGSSSHSTRPKYHDNIRNVAMASVTYEVEFRPTAIIATASLIDAESY